MESLEDTDEFLECLTDMNFIKTKSNQFIQDYQKTVLIYNLIGLRQKFNPIFLNRNLNYVINRKDSTDKTFKRTYQQSFVKVPDLLIKELKLKFDSFKLSECDYDQCLTKAK